MNRPFKDLLKPIRYVPRKPLVPERNWSVVKVVDGKVVRNVFVSLTREEAEGAAKSGNTFLTRKKQLNVRYKILQDVTHKSH